MRSQLDLIFSNNPDLIHTVTSKPCPRISDHCLVSATVNYYYKQEKIKLNGASEEEILSIPRRFQLLNFNKADWNGIRSQLRERMRLENDWSIISELEPEEGLLWFYTQLIDLCEEHVPRKKSMNEKKNPKIPYHRRKQWKRLQKLYKKLKSAKTQV